jgi:hypothetical protein
MKQTAVEWFEEQVGHNSLMGLKEWNEIFEKALEMEKKEKIEFACQVAEASAEKHIQGKTTWQIAEELLTYKSE